MGKRIAWEMIDEYLAQNYPNDVGKPSRKNCLLIVPYLQNAFGHKNNCTLTSIFTITSYYLTKQRRTVNEKQLYEDIEKIAKRHLYHESLLGTQPVANRHMMKQVFLKYQIPNFVKARYFKGIGYRYETICDSIDQGKPVLLSMFTDGRGYYRCHTVTVIGYEQRGNVKMLIIYDNWVRIKSCVDYQKLNLISMIVQ